METLTRKVGLRKEHLHRSPRPTITVPSRVSPTRLGFEFPPEWDVRYDEPRRRTHGLLTALAAVGWFALALILLAGFGAILYLATRAFDESLQRYILLP